MTVLERAKSYAIAITTGEKTACKELTEAADRFLRDLKNPAFTFVESTAKWVIDVIEQTFVHVKGDKAGEPFILEPWELFIVANLAGFYLTGTNERRFHEAFIFVPRKNGKTPFAAALAWALCLLDYRTTATLYLVANKLDRARESFDIILKNLEYQGATEDFRILDNNSEHSVGRTFKDADGRRTGEIKIQALAADAKRADGYNAPFFILDEIHAYKNANQYHVYRQGMKAYKNKLLIGITTAGNDMNSFCYARLTYCQKVLEQTVTDDQYFIFITKADNPEDFTNPIEHEKANPNYGVTIRPADMEAEALQALNDPSSRTEFLTKSLNIYSNALNTYFDVSEVVASDEKYNWTVDELAALPVVWTGGADLSKQYDLTAGCLYGEYKGVSITIAHGFIPIVQAKRKAEEDGIPFAWWADQGWLTLCNSEVIDTSEVVKWFTDMRSKGFKIRSVAFDKYNSRDFVKDMEKKKFKMENMDQAYWKKSEAFRYLERQIKTGNFYYLHCKAFEYCISNVRAVEDSEERIRFEKISQTKRIDLFDATVQACKQHIIDKDKTKKLDKWFS